MNSFKQGLYAARLQVGVWQALANPYTAEICAGAGFDWLLIDGEHAPNDLPLILAQLQAVSAYPVEPVVRLPIGETALIKQLLDIGARSLLVPMVESVAQARAMVAATRYPPHGVRGVGSAISRASRWNRSVDYLRNAQQDICLLVQIESTAALHALDGIVEVEGVDGIFIGPSDLAASLGHLGNPGHAEVQRAIEGALATIVRSGKAAGILAADEDHARRYIAIGASFVAVGTDVTLLARNAEALARCFKGGEGVGGDGVY